MIPYTGTCTSYIMHIHTAPVVYLFWQCRDESSDTRPRRLTRAPSLSMMGHLNHSPIQIIQTRRSTTNFTRRSMMNSSREVDDAHASEDDEEEAALAAALAEVTGALIHRPKNPN